MPDPKPLRVVHIISGLKTGGAEVMLLNLVRVTQNEVDHRVISLTDEGDVGCDLREAGATVQALGLSRRFPSPLSFLRLRRRLTQMKPDAVHTWMYHADLLGGLAARAAGVPKVIWHVHHTDLDASVDRSRTVFLAGLCAKLSSKVPHHVVYCSNRAKRHHERVGYALDRSLVIPNGFFLGNDGSGGAEARPVREEYGIPRDAKLVLHIGGFRPQKDHKTLLQAARRVIAADARVHFLLCGSGVTSENPSFGALVGSEPLGPRIHFAGFVEDLAVVQREADLFVLSSSHGEAFPLVLGEAMATGIPCVTTDVGDAAEIVADAGYVVPPKDAVALADAILKMCALTPEAHWTLADAARIRIKEFPIENVGRSFVDLYGASGALERGTAAVRPDAGREAPVR